jgi:MFS family permease
MAKTRALSFSSRVRFLGRHSSPRSLTELDHLACCGASADRSFATLHVLDAAETQSAGKSIEHLGRQRPDAFPSLWLEAAFVFSIAMSQILVEYFVSGLNVLLPVLIKDLDIPSHATVWPASIFSLVTASTLLVFGRLTDKYGGFRIYVIGFGWLTICSVVAGFSSNLVMLTISRACMGFGTGAFLPSGTMLLGNIYRPGPRKNIVFSIYGASAVIGFFIGILCAGIAGEHSQWRLYFWIGAGFALLATTAAYFSIPPSSTETREEVHMDWLGAAFLVPGLFLVTFAVTNGSHAPHGWSTPYIPMMLVFGVILLGFATYVEGWRASQPLLPFDIFNVPYMKPLCIVVLLNSGTYGVYLFYGIRYFEAAMRATTLQVAAWFTPMVIAGLGLTSAGALYHLISGTGLLVLSGVGWIISVLLLAVIPIGGNYWAFIFPSMVCSTIGIDLTFNIANIFITTNVPSAGQGAAGALIWSLSNFGVALLLGFADIIDSKAKDDVRGQKSVFWYSVICTVVALSIVICFVRVKSARAEMTMDEKRLAEQRERQHG